jgi:DNA-binding beta-propeller fold protein YncE
MRNPLLLSCVLLIASACSSTAPLHPPGSAALVGCAGELDWIHLDSGQRKRTYPTCANPAQVRVAPSDGQVAILDRAAETITVFDLLDRVQRRVIQLPSGSRPTDIEFLDKRSSVGVACSGKSHVLEVGLRTGDTLSEIECSGSPIALASDVNRAAAYIALSSPASVIVMNTKSRAITHRAALPATPTDIAATPSGDELWVTSATANTIMVVDPAAASAVILPCPGGPTALRLSYDGRLALVLCEASGEVATFDVRARTELRRSTPPSNADGSPARPSDIELEPPGVHLLVVSPNANRLDELDLATGRWVRNLPTASRPTSVGWCRVHPGAQFSGEFSLR